jgi:DNA-binding LytR/AlgR family response regulator
VKKWRGNMWEIAICESDPEFVELIEQTVREFYAAHEKEILIKKYADGCSLIDCVNEPIDLIFLDTRLKDVNGYSLAEMICSRSSKKGCYIIFLGRDDSNVSTAFLFHPFGYIIKDRWQEDAVAVLTRLWEHDHRIRSVGFTKRKTKTRLRLSDIMYIEIRKKTLLFCCTHGESYRFTAQIRDYEMLEDGYYFVHSTKSFLVNCAYVKGIKGMVYLKDGTILPCSDSCSKKTRRMWKQYMRDTMRELR